MLRSVRVLLPDGNELTLDEGASGRLPGRPFPGFGWAALAAVADASLDDVLASWSDVAAAGVAP